MPLLRKTFHIDISPRTRILFHNDPKSLNVINIGRPRAEISLPIADQAFSWFIDATIFATVKSMKGLSYEVAAVKDTGQKNYVYVPE